jgi:hypothetical protein
MPKTVFDEPGRKVRLDDVSAQPPKGMTREKVEKRFASLGKELFDLQDATAPRRTAASSTSSAASTRAG